MNKIELLAPAGDLERLKIAIKYGADAVYIGGQNYSLRANARNFSLDDIKEACKFAHKLGKRVYVTVNIVFHNEDYIGLVDYLKSLAEYGVDAIIVSDMSIIDIVRDNNIKLPIHISTQMSNANYLSINYLKGEGVSRVVLARETSREEIKTIIEKTGMEVECFLHGAMCSSYSGRCVLSNYFTRRDANRGGCAQICRWCFDLEEDNNIISGDTKFTMSCKDLSLINYIGDLIDIGVKSLKIEGRMRSNYYIATVISTYRNAIDDYYNGNLDKKKINYYSKVLNRVANRDSIPQFFNKFPGVDEQYFLGRQEVSNQDFLGIVLDYNKETHEVTITERNYFKTGDIVEIFGPNTKTFSFKIPIMYNSDGESIDTARHPEEVIKFKLDKKVCKDDIMRVKIS